MIQRKNCEMTGKEQLIDQPCLSVKTNCLTSCIVKDFLDFFFAGCTDIVRVGFEDGWRGVVSSTLLSMILNETEPHLYYLYLQVDSLHCRRALNFRGY